MQKLSLSQSLQQKLSPQQIQFIKLLQIPTAELDTRIEEELEINPALEEGMDEEYEQKDEDDSYDETDDFKDRDDDLDIDGYIQDEDYAGYKMQGDGNYGEEDRDMPLATSSSLMDSLLQQFGYLNLSEEQRTIGYQLIGSIEADGYIRRSIQAIVNDLAFSQNVFTDAEEVEAVLHKIQSFDPAGIGARSLPECLLLQLRRKDQSDPYNILAIRIIDEFFDEFSKKHYDKIQRRLNISDESLKKVIDIIIRLNPKPGSMEGEGGNIQYLIPDFLLSNTNGKLELSLNSKNAPELRISRSFADMLDTYDKSNKKQNKNLKETVTFVKQKLDAAKWFIDAIKQRQQTLLRTMNAIVRYQYDFFLTGDESRLRPMILKDIATLIDMDVSTVSRVANSKAVQTEFGIYPLKYFFSEGISTDTGEDVSSREVKNILRDLIDAEPKLHPLSDDKLEKILNDRGYNIARRTVAKYREQLNIPVARLRKQL
ncbi:RNA polymerase factor sigma-54 [Spirosoma fluviale]|uniref:RNA polymerase, sigma 54 subunit, RpoN/SigL n=1 Tax=Spirosoma fluviale TaxID=1597977 RepID=A0A286F684_9BACT|nr:RNA polymerase factor sigma-54 [Spirosoma fluviale]SOD78710.1 RNA polymerase, sigma 54 subunit, RpoN/SigL [Spirosoma fluviale]